MNSRVEHFIPPKGTLRGEWDEVAGLIPSPDKAHKSNSKRRVSLFLYKSYRRRWKESPSIKRAFPTRYRPMGQLPAGRGSAEQADPMRSTKVIAGMENTAFCYLADGRPMTYK